MRIALPAVDEHAVACGERMYALLVSKLSGTAQDNKEKIGSKAVALTDMRPACLQFADLLQMQ